MLLVATLSAVALAGCGSDSSADEADEQVPTEVQAALDRLVAAVNAHDAEALRAAVNPAVFERVWAGQSFDIDYYAGRLQAFQDGVLVLEHFDQIAVHKNVATENTYYIAVTAEMTSDEEPGPVNGIIVYTVTEFPGKGWLVTKVDNTGM